MENFRRGKSRRTPPSSMPVFAYPDFDRRSKLSHSQSSYLSALSRPRHGSTVAKHLCTASFPSLRGGLLPFQKGTFLNAAVRAGFVRHKPQTSVEGLEKYDLMKILSKRFPFVSRLYYRMQTGPVSPNHLPHSPARPGRCAGACARRWHMRHAGRIECQAQGRRA